MGQAAVDLPDPTQTPYAVNPSDADDLLSQLAGDEIDRLLAAADEPGEPAEAAVPTPAPVEEKTTVIAEATTPPVQVSVAPSPSPTPAVSPENVPQTEAVSTPLAQPDKAEPTMADVLDAALAAPPTSARQPVLVRLLELLNSPFAAVPDELREILGKLAILTTVNAVAVLAYVMLFRKH